MSIGPLSTMPSDKRFLALTFLTTIPFAHPPQAWARGVDVKLLIGNWSNSYPPMFSFLRSLAQVSDAITLAKKKGRSVVQKKKKLHFFRQCLPRVAFSTKRFALSSAAFPSASSTCPSIPAATPPTPALITPSSWSQNKCLPPPFLPSSFARAATPSRALLGAAVCALGDRHVPPQAAFISTSNWSGDYFIR